MITDRTKADVNAAAEIRKNKLQQGMPLTAEDIAKLERGMLTRDTINRIESKQSELRTRLNDVGYWNTDIETKQWTDTQMFDSAEFYRVTSNAFKLRDAFYLYRNTPRTFLMRYDYTTINSHEKLLVDIESVLDGMQASYIECGTRETGEG